MNLKTTVAGNTLFNRDKIKIGFELLENKLGYKELCEALISMHSQTERANILDYLVQKGGYAIDPVEFENEIEERYQIGEYNRKKLEEYKEKYMMERGR